MNSIPTRARFLGQKEGTKDHSLLTNLDYASAGHTGFEPSLPATPENPETKFLNGNRDWAVISVGAGGFAGNLYFTTIDSDVAGYKKISYTFEPTETELSGIVNNNEVLFRTYLYDDPIDTTTIDAGIWAVNTRVKVSGSMGTTQLAFEAFLYHADTTETTLFKIYSYEINNTTYETIRQTISHPTYSCLATDRFGVRIYGKTTANNNITISTIVGDGNASYFDTPIPLRHNLLRGLEWEDGGHIGTANKLAGFDSDGKATTYDIGEGGPTTELDGGFIATNYLLLQAVDAGFAGSVFTSAELVDGGNA